MGKPAKKAFKELLAAIFCVWALAGVQAATREEASFTSLDGTAISAVVFRPAQSVVGTVITLHGCGGLYTSMASRKGQLSARHQAMADMLVAEGYAVVFPDSFTPRGETGLCTQKTGTRQLNQTQRRADALAAMAWVAAQPWAQAGRMALLGWSHGGSAVLSATDANRADVRSQSVKPAVAVAFYPGCAASLKSGYKPHVPLVLMLGEKDDWTPPGPCLALRKAAGAEVNLYPDSYHDFDNPTGTVRLRSDIPNGVNSGQGVHAGANPAARQQAYARLREVLKAAFTR